MQRYNIDTCAMLVEVSINVWTARKLDKSTTDEVISNKKAASKSAARVNKHLLAGRNELEVINTHVAAVRTYVYENTLPWSDSGLRLLPSANFHEFNTRLKKEEDTYWSLCKAFVEVYPTLITAQALQLGDMFKREDFPTADQIIRKFGFTVTYLPVPKKGDFRVNVGNEAQEELEAQLAKIADERVQNAMNDVRQRLRDHLQRMSDRLTVDVVNNKAVTRKFHDSLIENGFDLCDVVRSLNVLEDPDLENARLGLERCLNSINARTKRTGVTVSPAETLREDMAQRSAVKAQVDEILNKFTW